MERRFIGSLNTTQVYDGCFMTQMTLVKEVRGWDQSQDLHPGLRVTLRSAYVKISLQDVEKFDVILKIRR